MHLNHLKDLYVQNTRHKLQCLYCKCTLNSFSSKTTHNFEKISKYLFGFHLHIWVEKYCSIMDLLESRLSLINGCAKSLNHRPKIVTNEKQH